MVSLKKWTIIIVIILLISTGYVVASYLVGMDYKKSAEEKATTIALNQGGLVTVDEYYLYHGDEAYSVVVGEDEEGVEQVLWIPKNLKNNSIKKMRFNEGVSKEEVLNKVNREYQPIEIVSVKIGMKNDNPIWEITHKDKKGNLIYTDYDFKK